jgi:hypothetical protein
MFGFLSGCAITGTFGEKPEPVIGEEDTYSFPIYYNIAASDSDIDKAARIEIEKIKYQYNYRECAYERIDSHPLSGEQKSKFKVKCER